MGEVHDGFADAFFDVFEADEVLHGLADDDHVVGVFLLFAGIFVVAVLALGTLLVTHEVEVGHLHAEQCLVSLLKFYLVLRLDSVVCRHEVSFNCLPSERLLANIIVEILDFDIAESLCISI